VHILEDIVNVLNNLVWGVPSTLPWIVFLLFASGLFITVRMRFIQMRRVRHALKVVRGDFDDPAHAGDINHFQALSTALSATVGIGNIAGVAIAIHHGGPGAVFWMWLTAVFGMALKYAECTMSMLYRDFDEHGQAAGGPMYYIEKGLGRRWRPMALFFAGCTVIASFGGGNMNQSNTVAKSAVADFGANPYLVGVIAAIIVGAVILGGIKRIGQVSGKLAPAMAIIYVGAALVVLVLNITELPAALWTILSDAFTPRASLGGSVAGTFMVTLVWGVKRGLFSNEAGQGSAPIAHAAAKTDEPVREGVVAMLGPLIDTLIICTMTALVIVVTGVWDTKHDIELRSQSPDLSYAPAAALGSPNPDRSGLQAALAEADRLKENQAAPRNVVVISGEQRDLAIFAYDGLVEGARLVDGGGAPFTGTLRYVPAEGRIERSDGGDLYVRGRALQTGSPLTALAFRRGLDFFGGGWGNYIVTLSVFLFALSTMISWSYYGDRAIVYLFGYKWVMPYRLVYVTFVFIGAPLSLDVVWAYGDLAIGLMTVPNLIAVLLLSPQVAKKTAEYFGRMEQSSKA
jgi:AGCS family alanine or glycine:cation symporter